MAAGMLGGKKLRGWREIALLIFFGIVAAQVFGILMDLQFWPWALGADTQLSYLANGAVTENLSRFFIFHFATAMAWDIPRAVFTTILLALSGRAVLSALRRTKTRAAFLAPIEFNERAKA
jgi:energy-coupling factor transport system substrate-specific component